MIQQMKRWLKFRNFILFLFITAAILNGIVQWQRAAQSHIVVALLTIAAQFCLIAIFVIFVRSLKEQVSNIPEKSSNPLDHFPEELERRKDDGV